MLKIIDNNYFDLIVNNIRLSSYENDEYSVTQLNDTHSLIHVLNHQTDACVMEQSPYETVPMLFKPTSTISMEPSGIMAARANPEFHLYGQGVLVGIIDTGIDYLHPAFLNADGTTRIASIWDQTIQEGLPPPNFTFGTEYNRNHVNAALSSMNPSSIVPSTDTDGHGTAIASIIAGTPTPDLSFLGIAPSAELVVVKLKEAKQILKRVRFVPEESLCYQESDIMLGLRYLTEVSERLNLPVVICLTLGSSMGSHDGHSPLNTYLDSLAILPGIGISTTSGNEAVNNRHYFNRTVSEPYHHIFALNIGSNDKIFSMEIWPYAPQRLYIEVLSPNQEIAEIVNPPFNECQEYTFNDGQSTLWVNNVSFDSGTGDPVILVRFDHPLPGVWRFRASNRENEPFSFHSWLPSGDIISTDTFFFNADPDTTITAPGDTMNVLTVTAYNHLNNQILYESGRGYTRSGLIKPDIAAPGFQLPCALPGGQYGTLTGTGAAAAHTSGAIALIMEWAFTRGNFTSITGAQINRMIIREAERGNTYLYPNNVWGYGRLNVNNLLNRLYSLLQFHTSTY